MGISIVRGRGFTDQDKAGAPPVVIVNETLARKHWPGEDATRQTHSFLWTTRRAPWMEIVGVIKDVKHELNIPIEPEYYLPHAQDAWTAMVLVARTSVDPSSLAAALRQQVWAIDKDQPVFDVKTMQEVRSTSVAIYSFSSVMLGIFAVVALVLAAVGIYGVMAFRGDAAHAGDRDSHGARRANGRRVEAGGETRNEAGAARDGDRIGRLVGAHSVSGEAARGRCSRRIC